MMAPDVNIAATTSMIPTTELIESVRKLEYVMKHGCLPDEDFLKSLGIEPSLTPLFKQ